MQPEVSPSPASPSPAKLTKQTRNLKALSIKGTAQTGTRSGAARIGSLGGTSMSKSSIRPRLWDAKLLSVLVVIIGRRGRWRRLASEDNWRREELLAPSRGYAGIVLASDEITSRIADNDPILTVDWENDGAARTGLGHQCLLTIRALEQKVALRGHLGGDSWLFPKQWC
jgi:hypothetical protein